jgi:hypothetical protein
VRLRRVDSDLRDRQLGDRRRRSGALGSIGLRVVTGSDATAPVISLVTTASLTFSAATITWTTNEADVRHVVSLSRAFA